VVFIFLLTGTLLHQLLGSPSHPLFYFLLLGSWLLYGALLSVLFGGLVWWGDQVSPTAGAGRMRRTAQRLAKIRLGNLLAWSTLCFAIALSFAAWNQGGVFRGPPLEEIVTGCYTDIFAPLDDKKARTGKSKDRREHISNLIFESTDRSRDLVITGSSLTPESRGAKYFYLPRKNRESTDKLPSYGSRGVEIGMDCDSNRLVDIALGSGTIFPVFPWHPVDESTGTNNQGKPYVMKRMSLIDGGFAHNSPVEAAVLWGATHIVLIGASPETQQEGGEEVPVIANVVTAFGFLYDQAQMADVNAQEEAAVFTLRPKAPGAGGGPRIGIIDFGPGFATAAMKRGAQDASRRSFVRQPAAPLFWDIK
jgi:hypothetical protein